ncbi:hypothetical protein BT96DRAFT_1077014 [Gymnopus androsaceus JB14]|uniref:Uncharacterized protein n=1 Tax=Gymnopus androsaceus JB14 TaxID=1447944 RepID=A0A6A4ICE9_9AGAR|nr:hypothetical protein BT96DRAFT_1077014 [Gymnopus androsaceus JB14]
MHFFFIKTFILIEFEMRYTISSRRMSRCWGYQPVHAVIGRPHRIAVLQLDHYQKYATVCCREGVRTLERWQQTASSAYWVVGRHYFKLASATQVAPELVFILSYASRTTTHQKAQNGLVQGNPHRALYGTAVGSDSQANNIRVLEPIILELLKLFGGEVTYDEVEYEENKELEIGASEVEPRSVCKEFRTRFGAIFHLIVIEVKDRINMASFAQLFAEMTGKTFSTHVVGFCSLVFLLAMCTANAKAGNEEFEVYGILVDQSISFYFTVDSRELAQRDEERKAASVTASSAAPSNAAPSPPSTTTYSTYPFKYGGSIPLPIGPPLPNFFTQTIHCEFLLFLGNTETPKTARSALFHLTEPITAREHAEVLTEIEAHGSKGLAWLQESVNSLGPPLLFESKNVFEVNILPKQFKENFQKSVLSRVVEDTWAKAKNVKERDERNNDCNFFLGVERIGNKQYIIQVEDEPHRSSGIMSSECR